MKFVTPTLAILLLAVATASAAAEGLVEELGLRAAERPIREDPRWDPAGPIVVRVLRPENLAPLQAAAGDIRLIGAANDAEALAAVGDATALLGFCSADLLAAGKKLRWIQLYSAGAEYCVDEPRVGSGEILLTNMQRVSSPQIAEHVIAMLLALTRGLVPHIAAQSSGEWQPNLVPPQTRWEISGRTLLVVGLGGIGTQVARRAHALGMRVIAVRSSGRPGPEFVAEVAKPGDLLEFAARADAVVNSVPLTPETTGLFDARFFSTMQKHAIFINVGRGASVVTDDLADALREGRIAGAGLDVTEPEPLPPDHPLWTQPNVIITPHIAAGSDKVIARLFAMVEENLRRYVTGEPMLSVVDPARGY